MVTHDQILKRIARALKNDPDIVLVKRSSGNAELEAEMEDGSLLYVSLDYDRSLSRDPYWSRMHEDDEG